jgi:hypothetical protein
MKFSGINIIFCLTFFIISCQKEYSYESSLAEGFLLKSLNGNCSLNVPNGNYFKDSILKDNNFIEIEVEFSRTGIYNITTDTVNGYYFGNRGIASEIGTSKIRLQASGLPKAIGIDMFKVKFGNDVCEFSNTIFLPPVVVDSNAIFTLGTIAGICTNFALGSGSYNSGIVMNANNTVTLQINVTKTGNYNLSANTTPNVGITFNGTGTLQNLGSNTITLIAQGTPNNTVDVTKTFSVSSGSTNCNFSVNFIAPSQFSTFMILCAGTTFTGSYIATYPLNDFNTIRLIANATTSGAYSITTNLQNGVKFTSSGNLNVGNNIVLLKAIAPNNIPLQSNLSTYLVSGGSGGSGTQCSFSIFYQPPPSVGSNIIEATINGNLKSFNNFTQATNTSLGGINNISIYGKNGATGNEEISFTIEKEPDLVVVGVPYSVNATQEIINAKYINPLGIKFQSINSFGIAQNNPFTIIFSEISLARIKGTFFGTLKKDNVGPELSTITNGRFDIGL